MKSKFRKNTNVDQWGPNNFSCRGQFFEKWFKYTILPTLNNFLKLKKYIYKKLKQYLFFFFLDFNLWCLLGRIQSRNTSSSEYWEGESNFFAPTIVHHYLFYKDSDKCTHLSAYNSTHANVTSTHLSVQICVIGCVK